MEKIVNNKFLLVLVFGIISVILFYINNNYVDKKENVNIVDYVKIFVLGCCISFGTIMLINIGNTKSKSVETPVKVENIPTESVELKQDISPISNALNMINSLTGNTFAWKSEASVFGNEGMDTGIIAQEVEALGLPGIAKRRGDGTLGVRYDRLIPVLIEAVKELSAKVKSLESNK